MLRTAKRQASLQASFKHPFKPKSSTRQRHRQKHRQRHRQKHRQKHRHRQRHSLLSPYSPQGDESECKLRSIYPSLNLKQKRHCTKRTMPMLSIQKIVKSHCTRDQRLRTNRTGEDFKILFKNHLFIRKF